MTEREEGVFIRYKEGVSGTDAYIDRLNDRSVHYLDMSTERVQVVNMGVQRLNSNGETQ